MDILQWSVSFSYVYEFQCRSLSSYGLLHPLCYSDLIINRCSNLKQCKFSQKRLYTCYGNLSQDPGSAQTLTKRSSIWASPAVSLLTNLMDVNIRDVLLYLRASSNLQGKIINQLWRCHVRKRSHQSHKLPLAVAWQVAVCGELLLRKMQDVSHRHNVQQIKIDRKNYEPSSYFKFQEI